MRQQTRKKKTGNGSSPAGVSNLPVAGKKKKRVWIQPKDKSQKRKKFIKIRDARARSAFCKIQKNTNNAAEHASSADTSPPPIASAFDDDAFLMRLMDPFAKAEGAASSSADSERHSKPKRGAAADGKQQKQEEDESIAHAEDRKGNAAGGGAAAAASASRSAASSHNLKQRETPEEPSSPAVLQAAEAGSKKPFDQKGYVPFLKARRAFEEKQREKEAARLARDAEARERASRRREKKKIDKETHKKLQARTKKGQLVMGNVLDVLMLKMLKKGGV